MQPVSRQQVDDVMVRMINERGTLNQDTVLDCWRDVLLMVLERCEPDAEHEPYREIARDIVRSFRQIISPASGPSGQKYEFISDDDLAVIRSVYIRLNNAALVLGAGLVLRPFSDPAVLRETLQGLQKIAQYVRECMETINDFHAQGTVTCSGEGFQIAVGQNTDLLMLVLGPGASEFFRKEYLSVTAVLDEYLQMANTPDSAVS